MRQSAFAALVAVAAGVAASSEASHKLWYSKPAARDFFDALPIGNGRLGATIHGYPDKELVRLNEESIWSGGPIEKIPETAKDNLKLLREQILNGSLTEAGETWSEHFVPWYDDMRRYQPAGELRVDFKGHGVNSTTEYRRELDISTGIASVSYKKSGITYKREAFGNYPNNVLGFRLSADEPGSLTFDISLTRDLNVTESLANEEGLALVLQGSGTEDDTYRFASRAHVVLSNGKLISILCITTWLRVTHRLGIWKQLTLIRRWHGLFEWDSSTCRGS